MDIEREIALSKFRRWASSVPSSDFIATVSSSAAFMAVIAALASVQTGDHPLLIAVLIFLAFCTGALQIFFIALLAVRTWAEYVGRTNDTSLAGKMESEFEGMLEARVTASRRCLEYYYKKSWGEVGNADGVHPLLDFFEELGAKVKNNLISDGVAHQYFYVHLRMYCHALKDYVPPGGAASAGTMWGNIGPLFTRLFLVEKDRGLDHGKLAEQEPREEDIIKFLRSESMLEIAFVKPYNSRPQLALKVTNKGPGEVTVKNAEIQSFDIDGKPHSWIVESARLITIPPRGGVEIPFTASIATFRSYDTTSFYGIIYLNDGATLPGESEAMPGR